MFEFRRPVCISDESQFSIMAASLWMQEMLLIFVACKGCKTAASCLDLPCGVLPGPHSTGMGFWYRSEPYSRYIMNNKENKELCRLVLCRGGVK